MISLLFTVKVSFFALIGAKVVLGYSIFLINKVFHQTCKQVSCFLFYSYLLYISKLFVSIYHYQTNQLYK